MTLKRTKRVAIPSMSSDGPTPHLDRGFDIYGYMQLSVMGLPTNKERLGKEHVVESRLLSVVQISDLHFGSTVKGGTIPAAALLRASSHFEGWLDHHQQGVRQLAQFFRGVRPRDPAALLAVSGDLTSNGADPQFALIEDFLGGSGPQSAFGFGLGVTNWRERTIPGNHDHWPGSNFPAGPPSLGFARCFPNAFPAVQPLIPLANGVTVRFILVNSDADVGWLSYDRFAGRGRFDSQFAVLDRVLPPVTKGEIRVMLVHHAVADDRTPTQVGRVPFPRRGGPPRHAQFLEIDPISLALMERALVRHSVRVVMTGHLHEPRLTEMTATDGSKSLSVLETRCGTTTQQDQFPPHMLTKLQPGRSLPPNSLILHELVLRGDQLIWRASIHWRSAGSGFVCRPAQGSLRLPSKLVGELPL